MEYKLEYDKLSQMDKWALSKLNTLVKEVDSLMQEYKVTESARLIQDFTDELSNWYIRRGRERYWAKGMEQDKINAYMTLYTCLVTLAKVSAPFVPFMTEEIYQNLVTNLDKNAPESIHLCDFPVANEEWIDKKLEENMEVVLKIVTLGRACRNVSNRNNRQVLAKCYVGTKLTLDEEYKDIIKEELNVKEVIFTNELDNYMNFTVKPNFNVCGPIFGPKIKNFSEKLLNLTSEEISKLQNNEKINITIDENSYEVTNEMVDIRISSKEGFNVGMENNNFIILNTNLTEELILEGIARELVSKIQNLRKNSGFEIMDRITIYYSGDDKFKEALEKHSEYIKNETLANEIIEKEDLEEIYDLNGHDVKLDVERI